LRRSAPSSLAKADALQTDVDGLAQDDLVLAQRHAYAQESRAQNGKGGGYRLTMSPSEYTIGRILRLTETSLEPVGCIESGSTSCPKASECRTIGMWMKLGEIVNDYLDSITLADLLAQ
jgi:Rrf2 family protein